MAFSKCSTGTSSNSSITWELIRNANFQTLALDILNQKQQGLGLSGLCFHKHSRWFWCMLKLKTTGVVDLYVCVHSVKGYLRTMIVLHKRNQMGFAKCFQDYSWYTTRNFLRLPLWKLWVAQWWLDETTMHSLLSIPSSENPQLKSKYANSISFYWVTLDYLDWLSPNLKK